MTSSFPPIAAGFVAATVSYMELFNSLGRKPCRQALLWIVLRLVIEGGVGAAAYGLVTALFKSDWFVGFWPVLLGGLCGSALLRAQLALLGSGQEAKAYGPAIVYQRLQRHIDANILDIDSAELELWLTFKLLPRIRDMPPDAFAERFITYLEANPERGRATIDDVQRRVNIVISDRKASAEERLRALTRLAVELRGRRFLVRLAKEGVG